VVTVFINKHLCLAAAVSLFLGFSLCRRAEAAQTLNVQNYGAKGNGTTDDQAALQKVFAIANRTPQSTILFPQGSYLHSGHLVVSGPQVEVLGEEAILIGNNADSQALVVFGKEDRVRGLIFNGVPGRDPAIAVVNIGDVTIEQNFFFNFTDCITISKSPGCTITSNSFTPGDGGTALDITSSPALTVKNNVFNGFAEPNLKTGIQCSDGDAISVGPSNTFTNLNMGINAAGAKSLRVTENTFASCAGSMNVQSGNTVEIDKNSLTNTDRIKVSGSVDVAVHDNHLSKIQTQGVHSSQNTGIVRIGGNQLTDCGLSASTSPPAVIYADGGSRLSITDNKYTGNTQHLQYFIDTPTTSAEVTGNTTNTTLPNRVGP
jgi:hypothetical protein